MPAPDGYETKFADFIKLCSNIQKHQHIIVANPQSLGDNYDEVIESLNRIADCGGVLAIAKRG